MSDVSEHSDSEFYHTQKKKEKPGGQIIMIKCLLTELGMAHGPRHAQSMCHDHRPNIFPSGPPTQSISTYYWTEKAKHVSMCVDF